MYDTIEEAKQKLEGSIVLFNNKPVYIGAIGGKKNQVILNYTHFPMALPNKLEYIQLGIDEPGWDFKSCGMKLGYTPVFSPIYKYWESVFLTRVPTRHSRQGLDARTTQIQLTDRDSYSYNWNDLLFNQGEGVIKVIGNIYPNVKEAFTNITTSPKEYKSIPIHRKMTLLYDRVSPPYLIYRNEKIGYTEDGVTFKLAKHKDYLREELVDMIGLKIA